MNTPLSLFKPDPARNKEDEERSVCNNGVDETVLDDPERGHGRRRNGGAGRSDDITGDVEQHV